MLVVLLGDVRCGGRVHTPRTTLRAKVEALAACDYKHIPMVPRIAARADMRCPGNIYERLPQWGCGDVRIHVSFFSYCV